MIIIPKDVIADIINHAREQAPEEACGLLVGVGDKVAMNYRLTNLDASADHFSLDPKEQFAVLKDIRPRGWEILAVYHSHPTTPARMSSEDLRLAFTPDLRYVIVSLMNIDTPELKSYTVCQGKPVEEPVVTEE